MSGSKDLDLSLDRTAESVAELDSEPSDFAFTRRSDTGVKPNLLYKLKWDERRQFKDPKTC